MNTNLTDIMKITFTKDIERFECDKKTRKHFVIFCQRLGLGIKCFTNDTKQTTIRGLRFRFKPMALIKLNIIIDKL